MTGADRSRNGRRLVLALILLAALAAGYFLPVRELTRDLLAWAEGLGAWGPVLVAVVYVPATVLMLPCMWITLGSGFLFGALPTFVAVVVGSNLGALAAMLLGRGALHERAERWAARYPVFAALRRAVGEDGLRVVLLTRMSPLLPYNLLNYAYGVTPVRVRDYALGTLVGMLPVTWMNAYLGSLARDLEQVLSGEVEGGAGRYVLLALGLVATVAVVVLVTRRARRVLAEARLAAAPGAAEPRG